VNGEFLFGDVEKEVLRKQIWQMADFCGVQVITHDILTNHFHVIVLVPKKVAIGDAELLRRYRVLHPTPTRYQPARLEVIEQWLATQSPEGVAWRKQMLALMGDVSPFMQFLKQRFSIWLNKSHNRYGTLWSERFKSTLMERPIPKVAGYVDLNCVRANLVADPKDYRFCGYGEAVAGNQKAREGLCLLFGVMDWDTVQAVYRQMLFSAGTAVREKGARISQEEFQKVIAAGGKLPLADVLRCRVRYFTDGAVLGSREFVETQLAAYRLRTGRLMTAGPRPVPAITDWGELTTLRAVRGPRLG
jgi:putative transposase